MRCSVVNPVWSRERRELRSERCPLDIEKELIALERRTDTGTPIPFVCASFTRRSVLATALRRAVAGRAL